MSSLSFILGSLDPLVSLWLKSVDAVIRSAYRYTVKNAPNIVLPTMPLTKFFLGLGVRCRWNATHNPLKLKNPRYVGKHPRTLYRGIALQGFPTTSSTPIRFLELIVSLCPCIPLSTH